MTSKCGKVKVRYKNRTLEKSLSTLSIKDNVNCKENIYEKFIT
jgi:hypothetical protein